MTCDTGYSLSSEGKIDPKYGGIITDITKLPPDTTFYVCNGAWTGTIRYNDSGKYISMENGALVKLADNQPHLLAIKEDYNCNIKNDSYESPCKNCMESYCYKNCDKYIEWENKAETILKTYTTSGLDKFLIDKNVIEDGSGYGKTCDKKQYICPNCGKIISRVICTKKEKPKYCYRCGQLLSFKGE